jgi:polyvinyl alcohol dehydrogenase (cytochrome)
VVFSGAMDGTLRAYSTTGGRIIWEYHTAQEFETVNDVSAKGGTLNGPGPTIVDGMLFTGSGYSIASGMPGNVLLAFGID